MAAAEGFVEVPGGKVWYRIAGDNEDTVPLLCLHGGPGFTHYYLEPLEALAEHRQVVFTTSSAVAAPTAPMTCRCGRWTGSSRNSPRSARLCTSTACTCSAAPGVACWPC